MKLSNETVAYNFKNEKEVEMVMEVMVKENIFLSAESFNDQAWKLLG